MDGYLLDLQHLDPFQKWTLICAAVLTVVYVVMRPFKKKKDPLKHPPSLSLSGQREVERQMTELLVELEGMARQMTAQLDTRAKRLEVLIKEADEKIALLQGTGDSIATATANSALRETIHELPVTGAADPRHAEIYELADAGQTTRQIAQQLGRPHGEIELILALRPPLAAASA